VPLSQITMSFLYFVTQLIPKSSMIPQTYSHPAEQSFALNELDLKLKPYLNFNNGFFIEAGSIQ
jgi:hypothetical protein